MLLFHRFRSHDLAFGEIRSRIKKRSGIRPLTFSINMMSKSRKYVHVITILYKVRPQPLGCMEGDIVYSLGWASGKISFKAASPLKGTPAILIEDGTRQKKSIHAVSSSL